MRIDEIDPGEKQRIDVDHGKIEKLTTFIQEKCSDALQSMQSANQFLYRGIRGGAPAEEFVGRSRDDRRAKSSGYELQRNIDNALKMGGFKALRSNSIYTISNIGVASWYGPATGIYIVFPINGFDFTWSPKVEDLYVDIDRLYSDVPIHVKSDFVYGDPNKEALELFLKLAQYQQTDLDEAIMSGNEIMIHGEYIALNAIKYKDMPEIRALIGAD
jgi:hypothetical protein